MVLELFWYKEKWYDRIQSICNCNKMRENWKNIDNINYIESIEEYKQIVIDNAKLFSNTKVIEEKAMEELGDDWKINLWRSIKNFQWIKK